MTVVYGSCFCDCIRYEVRRAWFELQNFHCLRCRKTQGAVFRDRAAVKAVDFARNPRVWARLMRA